jgi:hypothetical protein
MANDVLGANATDYFDVQRLTQGAYRFFLPLMRRLYLGTSSWTLPGWKGLVYDREATPARLSREGLAA